MKLIDIIAPPMAGHLHPCLGIAVRLAQEPGVRVRVLSTKGAAKTVAAAGLEHVTLMEGADERIAQIVDTPYRVGSNPRRLLAQFRTAFALEAAMQSELRDVWCRERPNLVLADFTMFAVGPLALSLGVPWFTVHPSPSAIEATSGPPGSLGGFREATGALSRARNALGRAGVRAFKRLAPSMIGVRASDIGLSHIYRADGSEAIYSAEAIFATTPEAIEYPRRLPASVRYVGPVLYTPPTGCAPLVLGPGTNVLVTSGTHLAWRAAEIREAVTLAAPALSARGIDLHVTRGHVGAEVWNAPSGIVVHDYIDYQQNLANFDAVVHHGGSGVTGHTLAAGLPSVVWPADFDQSDIAVRLVDAGVGVRIRTGRELADAVVRALDTPGYAIRAGQIAAEIARRPAVDEIAEAVLERMDAPGRLR